MAETDADSPAKACLADVSAVAARAPPAVAAVAARAPPAVAAAFPYSVAALDPQAVAVSFLTAADTFAPPAPPRQLLTAVEAGSSPAAGAAADRPEAGSLRRRSGEGADWSAVLTALFSFAASLLSGTEKGS